MTVEQIFMLLGAFVAGALVATGVSRWIFGRQFQAVASRMEKLEQARQFAGQQLTQARKQVEQLQSELGELRHSTRAVPRDKPAAAAPARDTAEATARYVAQATAKATGATAADGFADTLVQRPGSR